MRQMECGLSCSSWRAAPSAPRRRSWPWPLIRRGGQAGDWVEVEPASGSAIGFALLVFSSPCVFLLGDTSSAGFWVWETGVPSEWQPRGWSWASFRRS